MRITLVTAFLQIFDALINQPIGTDHLGDLGFRTLMRHKLFTSRHIDAVNILIAQAGAALAYTPCVHQPPEPVG